MIRYMTPATDHWPPGTKPKSNILPAALLTFLGGAPAAPVPKPLRKCALPGCINNSARDYCCAEHCAEHRRLDKERREQP